MTSSLVLDPQTTAFLFMDFQNGVMPRVADRADEVLRQGAAVLEAARAAGASVVFVRVAFRAGYPEVSDRNISGAALKQTGRLLLDSAPSPRDDAWPTC